MLGIVITILKVILSLILTFAVFLFFTVRRIYSSIQVTPPSPKILKLAEDRFDECLLFRLFPEMKTKIAWFPLGKFPTPLDSIQITVPKEGSEETYELNFWAKREDYCSEIYGGNKVRSLEFVLANAGSMCENENKGGKIVTIGGAGSNQIIATSLHGNRMGVATSTFWNFPEASHHDNGLNLLSGLSFPTINALGFWTTPGSTVRKLIKTIWFSDHKMVNIGGANPVGVLGQITAMLEVAEQTKQQNVDIKNIFLALGSGCTTAGILLGIVLARKFEIHALPNIKVRSVIIHHVYANFPGIIKMWVKKLAYDTAVMLAQIGGPDVTSIIKQEVDDLLILVDNFAEEYGQSTVRGENAKTVFQTAKINSEREIPYLCCCFTSKSAAAMLAHLTEHPEESENTLFWSSKSLQQPHGGNDSWEIFQEAASCDAELKKWMEDSNIRDKDDYMSRMNYTFS